MNDNLDKKHTLRVASEFSELPSGRFYSDKTGTSGEQFREEVLMPKLRALGSDKKLHVILDQGVEGYGSSFLVEGFAGVVKYGYMTSGELLSKLELDYEDDDFEFFKNKIIQYIKEATFNSKPYVRTEE